MKLWILFWKLLKKKVQQPCFYSIMQFLLFDPLTQVTTKIILIFFSLKTSFWCNLFFETCFFFSQNNVIWDLNCLFMMPSKRCFFFTLNYIWFRKYHWQIRPSKKIEHLNISMPHFQKGHEIKFFLGQTSCMICSVIITKQHGCTVIFVKKNSIKSAKFWDMVSLLFLLKHKLGLSLVFSRFAC